MLKYILKRIASVIPVLIAVSILVFMMVHLMPGDPAELIAGEMATEEDIQRIREKYGYDQPLYVQYFRYAKNLLKGDLGISTKTHRSVSVELGTRFPNTFKLALFATALASILGISFGLISAHFRYTILDNISMFIALIGLSIPPFYLGLMLMLVVCVNLGWLPITSGVWYIAIILPVLTLSARSMSVIARMTRSSMLEVFNQDYIQNARAHGYSEKKVVFGCALKNALNSIITIMGIQFGTLLGGAVVTEKIFGWVGIGDYLVTAIKSRDYQVVQSTILVTAVAFVFVNLFIDILYAFINPRIKLS